MQNATKLYRVIKAIQGLILVGLGIVICVLYNQEGLQNAIGYCVASVVLVYGVLTIGFAYMFQRGIASTDMIVGTLFMAVSIFLFQKPDLVIKFIPIVGGSALLIYAVILIIETVLAFKGKAYLRGGIYIFAACCFIALGTICLVFLQQQDGLKIVVMIIGIIIILAGLTLSILQLIQPKKDVILQGSTLVTETTTEEIEQKETAVAIKSSKESKKAKKKAKKEDNIKAIEQKKNDKKKEEKSEDNKDNKKATNDGSDDVIDIEPEEK